MRVLQLVFIASILFQHVVNITGDDGSTLKCRNPRRNYFYLNNKITSVFVFETDYCESSKKELEFLEKYPIIIPQNDNSSSILNVTWNQHISSDINVLGYHLKFITSNTKSTKCIKLLFKNELNITGYNKFLLKCVILTKHTKPELSSISPIINFHSRIKRHNDYCNFLTWANISISYNHASSVLRVTTNYSIPEDQKFNVILVNGSSKQECMIEAKNLISYPLKHYQQEIFISDLNLTGNFCIRLGLEKCANYAHSEAFSSERNDTINHNVTCDVHKTTESWNASILLQPIKAEKMIMLNFSPRPQILKCCNVTNYKITLNLDNKSGFCDGKTIYTTTVIAQKKSLKTAFSNVTAGKYCVRITPNCASCSDSYCITLFSAVKELEQHQNLTGNVTGIKNDSGSSIFPIVGSICATTFVITLLVIFLIRHWTKKAKIALAMCNLTRNQIPQLKDVINSVTEKPKLKILLSYCVKHSMIKEVLNDFVDVLTSILHCEVTINNYTTACKESDNFGGHHLQWFDEKLRSTDFLLIMIPDFDFNKMKNENILNEDQFMYSHSIDVVGTNSRMKWSDENVCVFRFDNCRVHKIMTDVGPTIWTLPKQMGNFFAHLHGEPVLESEFQEYWKNDSAMSKFKNSVNSLTHYGICSGDTTL